MAYLFFTRCNSVRDGISVHVDLIASLIGQIRAMDTNFDDPLAIGILLASIDVPELKSITAVMTAPAEKHWS